MFHMLSCGYNFTHEDGITIDRPTGTGFYVFVFHKSDAAVLIENRFVSLGKNYYVLYGPTSRQYYHELEKPFINDWIHFTGDNIQEFFRNLNFPMDRPIKTSNSLLISRYILELQNVKRQGGPFCDSIIDADLRSIFLKLCNLGDNNFFSEKSRRYLRQFTELRSELYGSPKTHFSVDQLAARVHLSKSYFQHIYKEIFGCAVLDDIINGRIEYAEYLLDNSSFSISEIAQMCGYQNDVHFMRQFKKVIGVTPSQYRLRS